MKKIRFFILWVACILLFATACARPDDNESNTSKHNSIQSLISNIVSEEYSGITSSIESEINSKSDVSDNIESSVQSETSIVTSTPSVSSTTSTTSQSESKVTSKPESKPESKPDTSTVSEGPSAEEIKLLRDKIDSIYNKGEASRSGLFNSLIVRKSYTTTISASSTYPDTELKQLTDGMYAQATFSNGEKTAWVGYNAPGKTQIIEIDFGKTIKDITDIGLNFCKDVTAGIGLPGVINVYIAQEGDFVLLGTIVSPVGGRDSMIYRAVLLPANTFDARKVKFEIKESSAWTFIDEIIVGNYKEKITENFYTPFIIPEIKVPELWNSSDSDYNQIFNLAKGRPYKIRAGFELEDAYRVDAYNTKDTVLSLTDGILSTKATYSDSKWFRFTRGMDREIVIDLGKTGAVHSYSVGFLYQSSVGVYLPKGVDVYVSENGVGWQRVHKQNDYNSPKDNSIIRIQQNLAAPVRARFVKFCFTVAPHVWIDEIVVNGTKNISSAAPVVPDNISNKYPDKYVSPSDIGGVNDVFLSYTSPNQPAITKEVYLPHVAYIENGKIKDTMFDSFLYLPYVSFLYSGGTKKPLKLTDWQSYIDYQFTTGKNINALDAAVGEVKSSLNLKDYKVNVFMSVLFPVKSQTSFGVVNGKNLNFTYLEDRKAAIKWLIDEQIKRFEENNYKNIAIKGFYWFTEEIDYSDGQIVELLRFTTDYVRSRGYISTWIPYYQASGFTDWKELGFDFACYQPNYAFNHTIPTSRIYDAAATAKRYGMCIELEVGSASAADVLRLKTYYYVGSVTGFMTDAVHMYYQGGVPGVIYSAYTSKDPYIHSLYKDTYLFIKKKFYPKLDGYKNITISGTSKVSGRVDLSDNEHAFGLVLTETPRYGYVKLTANGGFEYIPYDKIKGRDSFTVVVDCGFALSKPITVTVDIK